MARFFHQRNLISYLILKTFTVYIAYVPPMDKKKGVSNFLGRHVCCVIPTLRCWKCRNYSTFFVIIPLFINLIRQWHIKLLIETLFQRKVSIHAMLLWITVCGPAFFINISLFISRILQPLRKFKFHFISKNILSMFHKNN